jgi:hypothetical protein
VEEEEPWASKATRERDHRVGKRITLHTGQSLFSTSAVQYTPHRVVIVRRTAIVAILPVVDFVFAMKEWKTASFFVPRKREERETGGRRGGAPV